MHSVHCTLQQLLLPCIELDTANSLRTFYWNGKMSDPGHSIRSGRLPGSLRGLYCSGKMLDPGHSIGSGQLPGSLRNFIALEKCQTQGISGLVAMCRHGKMSDPGHSIRSGQLPGSLRTVWSGKMSDPERIQPTHVGIQTDLGPLFSSFTGSVPHDSSIQFMVALGYQKCSLRNELRMN